MVRYQRLEELGVPRFPDTGSNTDSSIKPMSHPAIGSNYQMSAHASSIFLNLIGQVKNDSGLNVVGILKSRHEAQNFMVSNYYN